MLINASLLKEEDGLIVTAVSDPAPVNPQDDLSVEHDGGIDKSEEGSISAEKEQLSKGVWQDGANDEESLLPIASSQVEVLTPVESDKEEMLQAVSTNAEMANSELTLDLTDSLSRLPSQHPKLLRKLKINRTAFMMLMRLRKLWVNGVS